jgi:hypothetical protein
MAMKQATRTNQAISLKGSTKVGISLLDSGVSVIGGSDRYIFLFIE